MQIGVRGRNGMFQAVYKKIVCRDAERIRDFNEGIQAGPALSYFDVADMFIVHADLFSEGFLGEPFPGAELADAFSKVMIIDGHCVPRFPGAHIRHDIITSKKNT